MKIVIISKATPKQLPPLTTVALFCHELGHEVSVITQNVEEDSALFTERGIKLISFSNSYPKIPLLGKAIHWYRLKKFIDNHLKNVEDDTIYWITGADTLAVISDKRLKQIHSIFQLNELNDDYYLFRLLYASKMLLCDKVVVPELNRSYITQVMYKLNKRPYVLPNKPYDISFSNVPERLNEIKDKIEAQKKLGRVVFIYQGFISESRDMTQICKFVDKHKDKCSLVLMGADEGSLAKYKSLCNDLIFVPFVTAPWHLYVTSLCDVGIMVYLPNTLNTVYCAPNKIWEYSKFGLAMVGNDIPGLFFLDEMKLGCTVSLEDEEDINNKLTHLVDNLSGIKERALSFYDSLDMKSTINKIITE